MASHSLRYPDPPITGSGWILRPWRPDDADAVVVACSDPRTQQFIPEIPRRYTHADAEGFIARSAENLAVGRAIGLAVADSTTGRAIGSITLHTHEAWHWSIGYWVTPDARGRGLAGAATHAYARWAFQAYPALVRLTLITLPDNAASQHVAERAGFTREGLLRLWDDTAGVPGDIVMFSLIRPDLDATG